MARDPESEEISSQSLGSLVNPVNTDGRKEVETAAGNSMREDQPQTHSEERKQSNSNSTKRLVASTPELRNMEYTIHQYMSKIFQFLKKRLGISASSQCKHTKQMY